MKKHLFCMWVAAAFVCAIKHKAEPQAIVFFLLSAVIGTIVMIEFMSVKSSVKITDEDLP